MQNPLISVVIPAYNEEKHIGKLLKSLKGQTYPNFEIIVVDNNCTDNTAKIARKLGARVVAEKKQGMIYARQRGFHNAKGEIIARTDADSYPPEDWLEEVYKAFKKNPDAVAVFGPIKYFDKGPLLKNVSYLGMLGLIYISRIIMGHWHLVGANNASRKEVLGKIKPHLVDDSQAHEDYCLSCHVSCYGKIVFLPSLVVSTSARRFSDKPFFIFEYLYRFFKTYFLHHPSHKLHKVR
jgi:glycosyltransferase involved in cell wall biosynthesis